MIAGRLKVAFLADYNVSLAEVIIPAADLSEQISTAGMEASGTGNMKLALNGALTIGTLDGANIEIRDHVGAENIAIFGMEAMDVMVRRKQGLDATDVIRRSPRLSRAINAIGSGEFSPDDPGRFESIAHALRYLDHYMVSADFDSYYEAQRGIDARWQVVPAWTRASILNVARMPWFSSDRTIREYAEEIWNVPVRGDAAGGLQEPGVQRGRDALNPDKPLPPTSLQFACGDRTSRYCRGRALATLAMTDDVHPMTIRGISCSPRPRTFSTTPPGSPPATAAGRDGPARITGPLSARSAAPPPPPSCGR